MKQQIQQQLQPQQQLGILELEHAIGLSGKQLNAVHLHPNNHDYVYISGACIVICDLNDPHKQEFLREHQGQITSLAISNSGNLLASGESGDNADVIIWNFQFKKLMFKMSEHDFEVSHVQFSHDDKLLFTCGNSADKKIFIWDTNNGFIVGSTITVPEPILVMKWGGFFKDIKGRETNVYQFATSGNKQIWLWKFDPQSGSFEKEYINTGSTTRNYLCLEFSKNKEDFLFAGTTTGDFCAFFMKNKSLSSVTPVSSLGVTALKATSPDQLIVGCGDGTLASYSVEAHILKLQRKITLLGQVNALSNGVDSTQTIIATDKGFVYRMRNNDLGLMVQSENHVAAVTFVCYPPGVSDHFASCSQDGTIRLWNVQDYTVSARCMAQTAGQPNTLAYNDEVVLSGWQDGKLRMFQVDGKPIWAIDNAHSDGVTSIQMSKNLKFICSAGQCGGVRVWETKSREMISHLKEHTSKVTKIQLINNDMNLLSASRDRALLLWDLKTEKRVSAHYSRMGGINGFAVVPNSNIVISTGQDRKITFWDLRQQNHISQIDTSSNTAKKPDECFALETSHDGRFFAAGGSNEVVRVWDINGSKCIAEEKGHSGTVNTLAFSYDDKQLISGGNDASIFIWNVFA